MKKLSILAFIMVSFSFSSLLKAQQPFVGQIMFVPYNFAPNGWHECDGSLLPISEYEVLFTLIGTTYGGDGQSTFAVPNAKGKVIIDDGQGTGLSPYVIGQTAGVESVTLTTNQMPNHSHSVLASTADGNQNSPTNGIPSNTKILDKEYSNSTDSASKVVMKPGMIAVSGGNQPHDNMMPTLSMKCVISLFGVFPSQN
ncbi:tail fiber protein [Epilithonimonas ginsengisoli]|uniref:Tail fiber protein n=1 Tax=Epilithonimonas ginsengisoli TaxID=1245592 RepID=A0ABU4JMV4_9FLAO|nr:MULTISPECIES: tail fiber protein [Chryseobacterium group]MBV6881917.1 tail fiber protein [Epilithonimonas sp. FP105]MDW8550990.1 tail fiber protein [Epilithonimonas ginsengisoli]OAH69418.1 phage tail protein [Chryseobacterium sp. FP211-J200]